MAEWNEETARRLEELCKLSVRYVPCQDDIRAALDEIQRQAQRISELEAEVEILRSECADACERALWPCGHAKIHPDDELCRECSP